MELLDIVDFITSEGQGDSGCIPHKRSLKDLSSPFNFMSEEEFATRFRFSKDRTLYIFDVIKDDIKLNIRANGLDPRLQLLCTLRFLATGHFQVSDGDLMGVSRHTARRSIHAVSRAIAARRHLFIEPINDSRQAKAKFFDISGFPNVISLIDGTHIPIVSPGGEAPEVYRCRKGFFSLNCQMVCNYDRLFTNIVVRWPGSTHDSRIFNECALKDDLKEGKYNGFLLGDRGYALQPYLMTPVANPLTNAEKRYNYSHSKTRVRVEQAFGVLKQRFRMLRIPLRMKMENNIPAIVAAVCLHNFAIRSRQPLIGEDEESDEEDSDDDEVPAQAAASVQARAIRGNIIRSYFN